MIIFRSLSWERRKDIISEILGSKENFCLKGETTMCLYTEGKGIEKVYSMQGEKEIQTTDLLKILHSVWLDTVFWGPAVLHFSNFISNYPTHALKLSSTTELGIFPWMLLYMLPRMPFIYLFIYFSVWIISTILKALFRTSLSLGNLSWHSLLLSPPGLVTSLWIPLTLFVGFNVINHITLRFDIYLYAS